MWITGVRFFEETPDLQLPLCISCAVWEAMEPEQRAMMRFPLG